jgi:serine/threonine protein kinase
VDTSLVRVLSRDGAPNEVLLVRRPSGRLAVLKRVRPELRSREDLVLRLDQERRLLTLLGGQHGLVGIEDAASEPGSLFVRFLGGGTLRDRLDGSRGFDPLTNEVIRGVAAQLVAAVGRLHDHDVIHRDINPTNIVFDSDGGAWLIDLSVAAVGRPARGLPVGWEEARVGTIPYSAPETILHPSLPVLPSVDIYSTGVVFWEMASTTRPFERAIDESRELFARRVQATAAPQSTQIARRMGRRFADLVRGMLDPIPSNRPGEIAVVSRELESAL